MALAVIVDRLAQDPEDIAPFDWGRALRRSVLARLGRAS
jgi:hypothetical protein